MVARCVFVNVFLLVCGFFIPPAAIIPDVPVTRVMWGTIPYVVCMMLLARECALA